MANKVSRKFSWVILFISCYFLFFISIKNTEAQDSTRKAISFFNQTELGLFIYRDHTEYGLGSQPTSNSGTGLSLQMVSGVLILRHFAVGPGIGVLGSYQGGTVLFLHLQ